MKKIQRALAVAAAAAGLTVSVFSSSAQAVEYRYGECVRTAAGWCQTANHLTLYYNSKAYGYGAASGFMGDIYNYDNGSVVYVFGGTTNGAGQGQAVKNNAGHACVDSTWAKYRVYYNSGYAGVSQDFGPNNCKDLNSSLHNQNASQRGL
ncbi:MULTISPECIES: hypothetical protein [unclassified Streptomyces]|uniref:hypothetical protein n=1 Tax=Streptomyces TaxID=1883 RepID=UPI0001C1A6E1|nr:MULTISPECIES: hypothetical protein [unclassified Streptomyces]MYR69635.1 hypothetical protein [Streptomyces sp. SID4939]MYS03734.1 hypothetical protein [Streptomyces sp. SID4940]MYT65131.1 hypothetical protein [Streptomyces sp. SID8357]MYT84993.1 hypothetical protein [Streptomyces sp. SID8360]MYU32595.1 hypothetical protein [Streptomyces sp. SID8358]MYW39311.1 hypothetical protein [Streptomyces sp. SID1]MYX75252.1 hypothetical protein [Streptomyces sp. SID3915]